MDDMALAYLHMQAYAYQSQLTRTSYWVAEQDGRDCVTVDDVVEAARCVNEGKIPAPSINLKGGE